jgi:hypothetical protein
MRLEKADERPGASDLDVVAVGSDAEELQLTG